MKKAYILLSVIFFTILISFCINFNFILSNYSPRFVRDTFYYLKANILIQNAKELAQYLLYEAKNQGKECLNSITLNYPKTNDRLNIEYFYPIAECKNFKITALNTDANVSKDGLVIAYVSIALNQNTNVNDEIFLNKRVLLWTKEDFWIKK
ncbi:hypothetical protein OQH60_03475 [Campylobacter sp. MIT 21-1685]|uniref:hypothetical protein n=1 Tax=unclassified Campylobacter TaxID=2593542 RepID=UPI00224B981C|nr:MULTISPECIES: hypothetical protein [unclassified Campylobacter]MCX2682923.1 hypothetical protein [Campylobacter sp. MIT 21-1684]MCX2751129.1 hypothetical protein [Campylobacter sp. MIT 21-1682]MCX2807404.1 hypothetical protein [Campylobacter sp. MIT 21-1685]